MTKLTKQEEELRQTKWLDAKILLAMTREYRISGVTSNHPSYLRHYKHYVNADTLEAIRRHITMEFGNIVDNEYEICLDGRFNDDKRILATIESNLSESEFVKRGPIAIYAALLDAANAEYYYRYEKQYT